MAESLYNGTEFVKQQFAFLRQHTTLHCTLKQIAGKLRFQILHTTAERLLRDKQVFGSFGNTFVFRCFNKLFDMLELHTITS